MNDRTLKSLLKKEDRRISRIIGSNDTYYKDKWQTHSQPERYAGLNTAALLVSPFWFAYRRMYGWMTLYFTILVLFTTAASFFPYIQYTTGITAPLELIGFIVILTVLHLLSGLKGNALYGTKVRKAAEAERAQKPDRAQVPLFSQTGASWISAVFAPAVVIVFAVYPWTLLAEWEYSPGLPEGAFVYMDELNTPDAPWEIEEEPVFQLFSSGLVLYYENGDPIGTDGIHVELYRVGEGERELVYERSDTFFRSSSINIPLLDTGDHNLSSGEYEVDVYVGDELQDTASFRLVSPHENIETQ
ncbi:DUF2628 domain-containing protein [Alteribacter natronophilus]|uniref:DUF2628 domain-containing protein n=1 Tax=Alteribacter natronophilus TaxID=2583810 RepID=UPI00110DF0EF|nr:DUF2628 domain-containing protein [Alteribacter natronophilus]TMW70153.1 DUF2628 domain-containing protein [Alteribacter natronophilus]